MRSRAFLVLMASILVGLATAPLSGAVVHTFGPGDGSSSSSAFGGNVIDSGGPVLSSLTEYRIIRDSGVPIAIEVEFAIPSNQSVSNVLSDTHQPDYRYNFGRDFFDFLGEGNYCFPSSGGQNINVSGPGESTELGGDDCPAHIYRAAFKLSADTTFPFEIHLEVTTNQATYRIIANIEDDGLGGVLVGNTGPNNKLSFEAENRMSAGGCGMKLNGSSGSYLFILPLFFLASLLILKRRKLIRQELKR